MHRMIMLTMLAILLLAGCTAPERQVATAPTPAEAFLAAGELPADFRIASATHYPVGGQLAVAPLGLDLEVSMPTAYGDGGKFTVTVNGQVIPHALVGGGFSGGRSSSVLRIYPGAPGAKRITVSYANNGEIYTARQDISFVSSGDVLLLEHYDGELLLAPAELQAHAYFVSDVVMACNGTEVARLTGGPGELATLRATPAWRTGRNELVMQWRDSAGAAREKKNVFIYAPDRTVRVGDVVPLGFGYEGSRSGPFFKLETADSTVVEVTGDQSVAHFPRLVDGQLTFGSSLQQGVKALAPGRANIIIMKSRYFLFPYEPSDSVSLTVAP